MATTSATSSTTSSQIDVSSVVAQLMTAASIPLDKLNSKVSKDQTIISDLGILKAKISSFKDALTKLESPSSYSTTIATSSNTSVATATSNTGAQSGRYNLLVNQTAEAANISVKGFTSLTQNISLPGNGDGFTVTVGANTYYSKNNNIGSKTGVTTPALTAGTVTDLKDWINKIAINNGENISANIVQTTSTSYALVIAGKSTGVSNSIGFTGLNGYSVITSNGTSVSSSNVTLNSVNENSGNIVSVNSTARDALLQINGLSFQKSSNTITDAVANISFNLLSPVLPGGVTNSALISVGDGADSSSTIIQDLVTSYNGFIAQYKEMVANSQNTTNGKVGSLSNRQGLLPFIGDIKNKMSIGALAADSSSLSLVTMGIDLQTDGTMKFNSSNYNQGIATGLLAKLRAGISVGGVAGSSVNLSTVLSSTINPGGTISSTIAGQTNLISASQSRIDNLKIQLSLLEKSYVSQYSRLNTLLFNLGQTSSQLTSALTAVTNINSGKT